MDVTIGWNTEYGRQKFSVLVTEADLLRMLAEFDIPAAVAATLKTSLIFRLLELEARRFSETESLRFIQKQTQAWDATVAAVKEAKTQRDALLTEIKGKVAGEPASH
jgi:hypothetical protein